MIVSIASGKGGTGKTTVAVNIALSLQNVQLLDCDVEEPNVHIFLSPEINETRPVFVLTPVIDEEKCDYCGRCSDFCSFNALAVIPNKILFFPELCHNCGGCSIVCPRDAISERNWEVGRIKKGMVDGIELIFGELNVGEPVPVPVINEVKKEINPNKEVLIDSSPGTSCPVIATITGSDYCLLVTEPTPFGLHDLKLMVEALRELDIPFGVVVNRAGIGDKKVYEYCDDEEIPILLEIPFNRIVAELYSRGIPFVQKMGEWRDRFISLYKNIEKDVKK